MISIGPSQPRVIIYITFLGLMSLWLCAKFQGHLTLGSGEDFYRVSTDMGISHHSGPVVSEEMFESVDGLFQCKSINE